MEASTCNRGARPEERQKPLEIPSRTRAERAMAAVAEEAATAPAGGAESKTAEMEAKAEAARCRGRRRGLRNTPGRSSASTAPSPATVKLVTLEQLN